LKTKTDNHFSNKYTSLGALAGPLEAISVVVFSQNKNFKLSV